MQTAKLIYQLLKKGLRALFGQAVFFQSRTKHRIEVYDKNKNVKFSALSLVPLNSVKMANASFAKISLKFKIRGFNLISSQRGLVLTPFRLSVCWLTVLMPQKGLLSSLVSIQREGFCRDCKNHTSTFYRIYDKNLIKPTSNLLAF